MEYKDFQNCRDNQAKKKMGELPMFFYPKQSESDLTSLVSNTMDIKTDRASNHIMAIDELL